jgi:hypothetical protein
MASLDPGVELTDNNDIKLETTLQELALNLGGDAVETNMALRVNGCCRHSRHFAMMGLGFSKNSMDNQT